MAKKNHIAIETTGFFRGTPERISPLGDKPQIRGAQQKTCLTAGFFVVRPSGFEPLAYRVGVIRQSNENADFKRVPVVMHKSDREKENPMNRCSTMAHGIFAFSSQTVVRPSSSHAV